MSPYQQFIDALSDDEVDQLIRGTSGISCNDDGYLIEQGASSPMQSEPEMAQVREQLISMEQSVLEKLYRQRPLCRAEFNYQASALLVTKGEAHFCHHEGDTEGWSLMIDDWRLVAVGPDDVRNKYGYFCEAGKVIDEAEACSLVMTWIKSGAAYDDYRSKTHCRFCL